LKFYFEISFSFTTFVEISSLTEKFNIMLEIKTVSLEKRKLSNGNDYRFMICFYYGSENGKPVRKYKAIKRKPFSTSEQYKLLANQQFNKVYQQTFPGVNGNVSITKYFKSLINSKSENCSKATVLRRSYKLFLEFIETEFKKEPLFEDINESFIMRYISFIDNCKKTNGTPLTRVSKYSYFRGIISLLRHAADDGLIKFSKLRIFNERKVFI
jgi:hypothetical protein